ncbi:TIGR03759 family integrating conjugative element protein [Pseudomonas sp. P1B16]|uniref:TIGR03759 family integrating conjugative element protein n=2 Tax=Pseudomonas TaxID=286 RepID=A0A6G6IS85_PSENT|nr:MULTISPECIES: TIGR03759 family integrating conjugative element protein [Pseudomonas]HCE6397590.1 TIGR03759 family integrating conjugative element protein [Pseudomonas aeruginosa]NWD83114.1 TIGR03759 family integrating conjugative element protein [Pseudomonas reactans]NWE92363.1 TIGR03759 family integrating conjugative element protein [Pseudomonas reactans]QIE86056.1 TIGR03759 family integrating conjugative element protein [Pseudomonas nitroreducens]WPM25680.1 TIGR03759 family integrating co
MKQRRIVPTLIVLLTSSLAQSAETRTADNMPSHERPMATERTDEQQARGWGLSTEEWTRFRALMQGPLGIYSPNLDPLTALGIEAHSEQERQRYAELQVEAEAHRVEKLLAYQRAYDDAWQRLHADMPRVILPDAGPAFSPATPAANGRIAVFVKDACAACDQATLRLQAAGMEFDIYVVDSRADDTRIRAWAQRIGIDPSKVRNSQITLNHDSGRWQSLGLQGDLPAVVRQIGGQWQRQP